MSLINKITATFISKKKVIFNSLWVVLDKVLRMVGGLVVGIWFARYVGVYKFGMWNYAYSIINISAPIINLGLNNVLLNELSKTETQEKKDKYIYTVLVLKILSGILCGIIISLYAIYGQYELITKYLLIILSFQCIFQCSDVFDVYYQSLTQSKNSVIAKTSAYIVINIFKVFALYKGYEIYVFAILTVCELVISASLLIYFYFNISKNTKKYWKTNFSIVRYMLTKSWPFLIAELLIIFYTRLDQIMIRNMVGNIELGKYSAAVRISEIWYFIAGALTVSLYPSLVKLKEKSEDNLNQGFQKLFNILTLISVVISIFFTFSSGFIINILYGEKYSGVSNILSVHIWTGVFVFLGVGAGNWLIINNLQNFFLAKTITGAIINLVLNIILIPKYQGMGAAIATLIAQIFSSVISNLFFKETKVVFWLQMKSLYSLLKPSIKNYT